MKSKEFECFFSYETTVQTHGSNEESAVGNLEMFLTDDVKSVLSETMATGVDYDEEKVEVKKIYDGWYELNLRWTGAYYPDAEDEKEAKKKAIKLLDECLTPFYQSLENLSIKNRRFKFETLSNEQITEVYEL